MLKLGLFLSVLLMLQSRCCANSDEILDDEESEVTNSHEVVDSFPSSRTYNAAQYPWRLWNFPYYQPRTPQIPFGYSERSPPLADPRFVTNRCNPIQSYSTPWTSTYPCYTYSTYITTLFYTLTVTSATTTTTTVTLTSLTSLTSLVSRIVETPSDNHSGDDATTDYISDISPTTPLPELA